MRVKLQLVLFSDDGHEETVTDIVLLKKDYRRIEHLGLTLAESKQLLKRIQQKLLQQQIDRALLYLPFQKRMLSVLSTFRNK